MPFETKVIGNPANHDKQIWDIVTGRLDYSADVLLGKKLFTRFKLSPYAHAKITSIDVSKALNLDGVEAVTTYEDCPPMSDTITYVGQEVAAVAAIDEDIASQAVELIDVTYDQLPFVCDPDEAMKSGAPLVGAYPDGNTKPWSLDRGDIETGFADADVTVEDTIGWTSYFQHSNIEPGSSVCYWTGDHLYVWTTSQNPFGQRAQIAGALGIPQNRVHLISHGTGLGCGDKHFSEWAQTGAVLSKKAGKPVQVHMSRHEQYVMRTHQFPQKATIKIGAKNDGTITAIETDWYADVAANGMQMVGGCNDSIRYTFRCPNGKFRGTSVATNKPRVGYWRCVAHPPCNFIMDQIIDQLAEKLGMTPLEFRYKNIINPDEPDQDSGRPTASNGLKDMLDKCADAIGYTAKYHAVGAKTLADGRKHGIAIRVSMDGHGSLSSPVGAIVNLTRDGGALISTGISRAAAGTNTTNAHIVAETLGMNYEDVNVGDWGNTDVCSDGGGQGGSTRTITTGAAFQMAAEDAREQAFETAAEMLGISADQVTASEGKVYEKGNPSNSKTWAEVAGKTYGQVVGRGYTWAKELKNRSVGSFDIGSPCEVRGGAGAACEVAVDTETGEIEVLNWVGATDFGKAIFYKGGLNQMEGGIEMQLYQALFLEQIVDNQNGATLNPNFLDQKILTTLDMHHDRHKAIFVESDDACGPYGCKGVGEPTQTSYGVINLAVYNATGVWIKESPITPKRMLEALGKA